MRHALVLASSLLAGSALAQVAPPAEPSQPLDPKKNQKIERIHHEDSDVKIDELRVGGQTQSITVQPKSGLPAYQVVPLHPARQRPGDIRDGGGQRVWNVLSF